ncbi:cuticular protein CPH42, partial [Danaus plexippus plexippus]|jgi:hypothetical protein
MRAF